jgi:hypothetical protein
MTAREGFVWRKGRIKMHYRKEKTVYKGESDD